MATLVAATGSNAKKLGARMLVDAHGRILGAVTIGGCVDARVIESADQVIGSREARLLDIEVDDNEAVAIGLTCGGNVQVAVEPVNAGSPTLDVYRRASELIAAGTKVVVVSRIDARSGHLLVAADGARAGTLGDTAVDDAAARYASQLIASGESGIETIPTPAGDTRLFFEKLSPPLTLVIVGAGEIAIALARLAHTAEMRVIVIDGRDRFATRDRFPDADDVRVGMPSEIVADRGIGANDAIVLVAHDYKYELPVLREVLRKPAAYIGLLGSRKRGVAVRQMLTEEGFTSAELARIHSPIGLDIGAKTPAEIAVSILAEVIAARSGKLPA
jgi:xanthine dehydrogenase accessory factor